MEVSILFYILLTLNFLGSNGNYLEIPALALGRLDNIWKGLGLGIYSEYYNILGGLVSPGTQHDIDPVFINLTYSSVSN